jgi:hypothetical protein
MNFQSCLYAIPVRRTYLKSHTIPPRSPFEIDYLCKICEFNHVLHLGMMMMMKKIRALDKGRIGVFYTIKMPKTHWR